MMKQDIYYPSVMALMNQQSGSSCNSTITIQLDVQYRMLPELCKAHAHVFYDYPITTFRPAPSPPNPNLGLFLDRIPSKTERNGIDLQEYEAMRIVQIYHDIQDLKLSNDDGTPFSIRVISAYTKTVLRIRALIKEMDLTALEVSTIDWVQGHEANAVIYASSRTKCADLNKCRRRGNVATSRARDILILMVHHDLAFASIHDPSCDGNRRLRFWGQILISAKSLNASDTESSRLLHELKHYTPQSDAMHHRVTRVNRYMRAANHALVNIATMTGEARMSTARVIICKQLCLKPKLRLNRDQHKNIFASMLQCNDRTFVLALKLFSSEYNFNKRNNQLFTMFGFTMASPVTEQVESLVAGSYYRLTQQMILL